MVPAVGRASLSSARFEPGSPVTLTFSYEDESGFRAKKTFTIAPESYVITFSMNVVDGKNTLNPVVEWGPGLGDSTFLTNQNSRFATYNQHSQAIVYAEGSVKRLPSLKVQQEPTWQGDYPFAGIDDHYFIASLVRPGVARLTYRPTLVPVPAIAGQPAGERELISFDALFATPPANVRVFVLDRWLEPVPPGVALSGEFVDLVAASDADAPRSATPSPAHTRLAAARNEPWLRRARGDRRSRRAR